MIRSLHLSGIFLFSFFLGLTAVPFLQASPFLESGPEQVSLLEVYSSEGCSSCPPADQWLARLQNQPGLWSRFVPIVFHVDYWDYLGWKDVLADPAYSARQRRYASSWNSRSVYTPGFVLNGREWRSWRSARSVPVSNKNQTGRLSLQRTADHRYLLTFKPQNSTRHSSSLRGHAALLGQNIQHNILRGENTGKTLVHHFAVVGFAESRMRPENNSFSAVLPLKKIYPGKVSEMAVAAWVTDENTLEVLQAVGGPAAF